jgi:hypothetical protein
VKCKTQKLNMIGNHTSGIRNCSAAILTTTLHHDQRNSSAQCLMNCLKWFVDVLDLYMSEDVNVSAGCCPVWQED